MENYVKIDRPDRRVIIRAQGHWNLAHAEQYHSDMQAVLDFSKDAGAITIFANLDGLILHTAEVSRRMEGAVVLMRQFTIERYALIVPSYLMRMQCRRLLQGIGHQFFDDAIRAKIWLGWSRSYKIAA